MRLRDDTHRNKSHPNMTRTRHKGRRVRHQRSYSQAYSSQRFYSSSYYSKTFRRYPSRCSIDKQWRIGRLSLSLARLLIVRFLLFFHLFRSDRSLLKFPRSLSDVRSLSQVLRKYRDENFQIVLAGFCAVYILSEQHAHITLAATQRPAQQRKEWSDAGLTLLRNT